MGAGLKRRPEDEQNVPSMGGAVKQSSRPSKKISRLDLKNTLFLMFHGMVKVDMKALQLRLYGRYGFEGGLS